MTPLLDVLPEGYEALDVEGVLVVVGPTGAFALCGDDPDAATAAHRVATTAHRVRNTLATRLSWAPFVDPLVVVDRVTARVAEATVVPRRMLRDVLTAGHHQLASTDISRIVAALESAAA